MGELRGEGAGMDSGASWAGGMAWSGDAGGQVAVASAGAAMVCAGAAAWVLVAPDRSLRRARALLAVEGGGAPAGVGAALERLYGWLRGRARHEWWCPAIGALIAVLGESVLPLLASAAALPMVRRLVRARDAGRERALRTDAVRALCGSLAGEVRAGRQPAEALLVAARDSGGLGGAEATVLAAARFGGDVPRALREAAREAGAEGLSGLAACWQVAVDRGAGLASGLERLEATLRAERDQRADLQAQLAGARSTALMLAGLPVLGLLLGAALGADPLHVLLHTAAGLGCLLAGGVLEAVGVWWALRIVRGAEG